MKQYFIDTEIYFQGEKQPPRKVYLPVVIPCDDGSLFCYDEDGNDYSLPKEAVFTE